MKCRTLFLVWLAYAALSACSAQADKIELIMPAFSISPSGDLNVFSTPIDVQNNYVAVSFVTDADSSTTPGYLNTVVRVGRKVGPNWLWTTTKLDTQTLNDSYHTQPSLAFDREGNLHVAYNMHNLPWQYVVSEKPYDASRFVFYGESVALAQLDALRLRNATRYPNQGNALIPGNQITYPAFFKNRRGELFVTYRYAMRPARNWAERTRVAGVARFDTETWKWASIGGQVPLKVGDVIHPGVLRSSVAFAYAEGYEPNLVVLAFDNNNVMHSIWTWWDMSSGLSGEATFLPSYQSVADSVTEIRAADVASNRIPGWSASARFNPPKSIAIAANGDVLVILEPHAQNRKLVRLNRATGQWGAPTDTPYSASKILVDRDGNEWVFASGLKLFKRAPGGSWSRPIDVGTNLCYPRPVYSETENSFYILAKTCSTFDKAVVYRYQLD